MSKFSSPFMAKSPLKENTIERKKAKSVHRKTDEEIKADEIKSAEHKAAKAAEAANYASRLKERGLPSAPTNKNEEYHIPVGGVQDISNVQERSDGSQYVVNTSERKGTSADTLNIPVGSKDYKGPIKTGDMLDETFYEDLAGIGSKKK